MAPTQSRLNPHHIYIPDKPHPNGCFFNSVADSNGLMLKLSLHRRMKSDIDSVLFNTKDNYHWLRNQFPATSVDSTVDQVQKLFPYSPSTVVCVDSYYGSFDTVKALALKGVYCVCKCVKSNFTFLYLCFFLYFF